MLADRVTRSTLTIESEDPEARHSRARERHAGAARTRATSPLASAASSRAARAPDSRPQPLTPRPEEAQARAVTLEQLPLDTLNDERK